MKKIPTVFQRNMETDHRVRNEVTPGCEWVLAGEGRPTRKWDGTCIMVLGGKFYRRYELKPAVITPVGFMPAQEPDINTGNTPGWVPAGNDPGDKWIMEARSNNGGTPSDGTYELVGPKINGNHDGFADHRLVPHGIEELQAVPRTFESIREFLTQANTEGIVWWHPDGRKAKIKGKDFGIKRERIPSA